MDQDSWTRIVGPGQLDQDSWTRTVGPGQLEQDSWNRTVGTGELDQDSWTRTVGTGQLDRTEQELSTVGPGQNKNRLQLDQDRTRIVYIWNRTELELFSV